MHTNDDMGADEIYEAGAETVSAETLHAERAARLLRYELGPEASGAELVDAFAFHVLKDPSSLASYYLIRAQRLRALGGAAASPSPTPGALTPRQLGQRARRRRERSHVKR